MPTSIAKLSIGSGPSAPSRDMVDQIMELVAQRVGPLVRGHFFLGRFSGDQLMIVMPELDELEAAEQATAYVKAVLGRPLEISGRAFKTPFSAGVAECLPEERRDEWILRADEALEVAQSSQAGRRAIRYSEL
jgi:diguanylate cyclase (GGDEF)-like protein